MKKWGESCGNAGTHRSVLIAIDELQQHQMYISEKERHRESAINTDRENGRGRDRGVLERGRDGEQERYIQIMREREKYRGW